MTLLASAIVTGPSNAQDASENRAPEGESLSTNYYEIVTRHGSLFIRLYDDTPGQGIKRSVPSRFVVSLLLTW